uniref:B-cell scaffold protein with ankyrin repeats n=1 Tax=Cyanoderma ruficeps TaxID=181631 RepID=A0A8C3QMD4_9PASS
AQNTKSILVIYEQEAEEWALYLESLFGLIVNKEGILLYDLENSSFKHQELLCLLSYKCKFLILSCGLLNCLNQKRSYFLEQVLKPPDNVVILLCGVENSEILYEILTLTGGSKEISTDQKPEEYISVVKAIIQPGNIVLLVSSEEIDLAFKTEVLSERLESNEQTILVLPKRISCENPGEIFILLKEEIDEETLEIEFIANNQRIRTQTASWNKKVKYVKALDFPAGPVYVNVYCGGVIKTTAQIEYYTALEEIEPILKKVADPIQALKFSSVEKVDNVLTSLLRSKISTYEFSPLQSEKDHLEEFPTLLHCAARFGLKNLATFLLSCPEATRACKITNKYGDDPESIAKKHGHKELRKLIKELSVRILETRNASRWQFSNDIMLSLILKAKQNSRDQYEIGSRCQQEAEVDAEKKDDLKDSREETEYEDEEEEDSYSLHNSPGSLYVNVGKELKEIKISSLCPVYATEFLPFSERSFVMDRSKREQGDGPTATCCGEDQGACKEDSEEEEEEHPYTCVALDERVYDFILGQEEQEEEKRKHCRSFIMNRPPAPAPRPVCSPVREENTPYIVQVFQQKACRVTSDNSRTYCEARNAGTEFTLIPPEQEELIHLQEQVKKGAISVDEALDRFKQWQNKKQRLPSTQQV